MVKVVFRSHDGEVREVEGQLANSVMETAVANDVPGIDANCGGSCACATCHVIVDPDWFARVGPPNYVEETMLEFVADRAATSRLACQIELTPELDGLKVATPKEQALT